MGSVLFCGKEKINFMPIKKQKLDQESYKREEKDTFHGSDVEKLKYIHTLVCFANYNGGKFFVKKIKKTEFLKSFFDAAVLENKLNSYIDPSISGIIGVSPYNKVGVKIIIKKSSRGPHFYKEDGYFINSKKEKVFIFKRGSIGIRRSGLNDVFNSKDFDTLLKNKLSQIFLIKCIHFQLVTFCDRLKIVLFYCFLLVANV